MNDVMSEVAKKKWRWAGHVIRTTDNRWTRKITEWIPRESKRKRGRQKQRWRDDLTKYRKYWFRETSDRKRWKSLEEGYVQQWTEEP